MNFFDKTKQFLGLGLKKDVEQLQETLKLQERLLEEHNIPVTLISSSGRETADSEDVQGTIKKRVAVKELQLLYLNNQFIFRGVNIRADELITRGYDVVGDDEKGVEACKKLLSDSGSENLFWQLSVNSDVAGDGYLEKVYNESKTRIALLKHINPVNFGFWTGDDLTKDKIILGEDKTPIAYMQIIIDDEGREIRKKISKKSISHLKFNTFGDEFTGISSLQPVYNTSIRLMNMENAAAEAAVKTANPTWVVTTKTKSPNELAKWASSLGKISSKEVVFLPDGVQTELMSPGQQNFSEYSNYFLDAVVAALGVPKAILTGTSGQSSGNRATTQTLSKHFYSVIRSNQRYMEDLFNKVFKDYAELGGFKPPKLVFEDIAEDADRNGQRAVELFTNGIITIEEARGLIGLETDDKLIKLLTPNPESSNSKIDPDKAEKDADMKTWHTPEPGSLEGSQKNEKRNKKLNPDVPSVR